MGRLKRPIRRFLMAEGYCVKCKAKKEIADGVEETMKNGRKAIKGRCPTCGVVMFKILGGKALAAPATASAAADSAPGGVNPTTTAAPKPVSPETSPAA